MKVLSLKEPYASLILNNIKHIETRNWKTNYRGKIYIHASKSDNNYNQELLDFVPKREFKNGYIICECELVDCIYMSEEYIKDLKNNNYQEYICGEYEVGRYAWILSNIKPTALIEAKGSLGLWDYYTPKEIMKLMQDIEYGWVDNKKNKHLKVDDTFSKNYQLQDFKEVIKNKIGTCWDQVELERHYFKGHSGINTIFMVYDDNKKCPTHTFLAYEENDKWYWFEHAWEKYRGIHEYRSLNSLLQDVKAKFIKNELKNKYERDNLFIYEYKKPKSHITVQEFYEHCRNGNEFIKICF